MRQVTVGSSGLTLSRLCFGTFTLSPHLAHLPFEEALDLIRFAFLKGVTTFETGKDYQTRHLLRTALARGYEITIIDQASSYTYEEAEVHLAESLAIFEKDEADVFLLSDVRSPEDWLLREPAWRYLEEAKAMGLVKAIGISTASVEVSRQAIARPNLDILLTVFNVYGLGLTDGTLSELEEVLRQGKEWGKIIGATKPLAGGMLIRDHLSSALSFVFCHPLVDLVSVGMVRREEVENCLSYAERGPVDRPVISAPPLPLRLYILDRCDGCEACIPVCPTNALFLREGTAAVLEELCDACGKCGPVCPEDALFLVPDLRVRSSASEQ
ncbi:MAG: aldo/keto reductase [Armatimonadetes bacterium]|nr:aldo/keto reductase [Armatimonadota bacterium]MDW8120737.1 aldo/keto reductase [Armatimonadota bacterium]